MVFYFAFLFRSASSISSLSSRAHKSPGSISTSEPVCSDFKDAPGRYAADLHAAFNIALFPPLFFFTGLYYTDVASTAFVLTFLVAFQYSRHKFSDRTTSDKSELTLETSSAVVRRIVYFAWLCLMLSRRSSLKATVIGFGMAMWFPDTLFARTTSLAISRRTFSLLRTGNAAESIVLALGVAALWFRQTNIFWVAVYPAGLTLLDTYKKLETSKGNSMSGVLGNSWRHVAIYDPPVGEAGLFGTYTTFMRTTC